MALTLLTYGDQLSGSPVSGTFEFNNVVSGVGQGDTLVLAVVTEDSRVSVESITDNYGNTWTQIPGARSTSGDWNGGPTYGAGDSVDLWIAQNVAATTEENLAVTVVFTGGAATYAGVALWDITGVPTNGCTVVSVGVASANTIADGSVTGPSLTADDAAVYIGLLTGGGAYNSSIASPWSMLDRKATPGFAYASDVESSAATRAAVFSGLFSGNQPWSISAAALVANTSTGVEAIEDAILQLQSGEIDVVGFRTAVVAVINS